MKITLDLSELLESYNVDEKVIKDYIFEQIVKEVKKDPKYKEHIKSKANEILKDLV